MKRVAELVPPDVQEKSGARTDQAAPLASPQELDRYDAVVVGCPTRYGRMAAQMAQFWDYGPLPRAARGGDIGETGPLSGAARPLRPERRPISCPLGGDPF